MIYYMHLNIISTLSHTRPMLVYYLLFVNEGGFTRPEKSDLRERPHTVRMSQSPNLFNLITLCQDDLNDKKHCSIVTILISDRT